MLVLDETGFIKKGRKSAGVQRQYSGTAGRIESCRVGVFLGYASRYGRTLIDRALYLPESWAVDRARRSEAGIPEAVGFVTMIGRADHPVPQGSAPRDGAEGPKLGLAMLERAHAARLPFSWVTADSVYGGDHRLRRRLQEKELGYALAVSRAQRLGFGRVEDHVGAVPPDGWHRLSAGDGAKGPRLCDWAYAPYGRDAAPGWEKGLLIRRSLADPGDVAFYLTHARHGTALADLVQVAGTRWTIEACFEAAKARSASTSTRLGPRDGLLAIAPAGMDRPPAAADGPAGTATSRSPCWPTPISPRCARSSSGDEPDPGLAAELLPLTVPELRRLLWHLVWPTNLPARPSSPGRAGDDATSSAPVAPTGKDEPSLKHGCSTRACGSTIPTSCRRRCCGRGWWGTGP